MASQLDIFGGERPYGAPTSSQGVDPTLAARQARKQQNRDRIAMVGPSRERTFGAGTGPDGSAIDPHTSSMEDYGIRNVNGDVLGAASGYPIDPRNRVPYGPHDAGIFRKAGTRVETPLVGPDALTTMQGTVHPGRVSEIAADRTAGIDPRFPANSSHNIPHAVELHVPGGEGDDVRSVLWNGNHRVAAAVERGEMFTPVQTIRRPQISAAHAAWREDHSTFRAVREERHELESDRAVTQDAMRTKPMSGRNRARFAAGKPLIEE